MRPVPALAPLSILYTLGTRLHHYGYKYGWLKQGRLRTPVISIGNLSTGGAGKTPFVIALANLLAREGMNADVLSRGYGRSGKAVEAVNLSTPQAAARYGDEPVLIARATNVPVYVGASRYQAGRLAESAAFTPSQLHLLDDGFQHWKLARDLDIVLLHPSDLSERVLPAGHLREPLSALSRANVVVLREEERDLASQIASWLRPNAAIWHIRRELRVQLPAPRVIAFCGIARPGEFFTQLRACGAELARVVTFPDHHAYSSDDIASLLKLGQAIQPTVWVTTEKDAERLDPTARERFHQAGALCIARLEVTLMEEQAVLQTIRALVRRSSDSL